MVDPRQRPAFDRRDGKVLRRYLVPLGSSPPVPAENAWVLRSRNLKRHRPIRKREEKLAPSERERVSALRFDQEPDRRLLVNERVDDRPVPNHRADLANQHAVGPIPSTTEHVAGQAVRPRMQQNLVLPADHHNLEPNVDRPLGASSFFRGGAVSSLLLSELALEFGRVNCPNAGLDDADDDVLDCVVPPSCMPPD